MNPEDKALLEKTYALAAENHQMLIEMRSAARTARVLRWVYWGLIAGLSVISLYYLPAAIQGMTGAVVNSIGSQTGASSGIDAGTINQLKSLLGGQSSQGQ